MNALECPSDLTLRAYQEGSVDLAQLDAVAQHVHACASCVERLQELESIDDPLLRALRRQQVGQAAPADPLMAAAVSKVLSDSEKLPSAGPGDLGPESVLNEYRLLEKLGAGGMGTVYRALHVRLGKEVALKVIQPLRGHDARVRERFQREMKAIGRLRHPHIVLATDAGQAQEVLYLVMELEHGEDLASYVRRSGPLPIIEACTYAEHAALGLQCAHAAGLVHRDVKPSNLLRTRAGQVKLLDLGLALLEQEEPPATADMSATIPEPRSDTPPGPGYTMGPMGTDDYMAPEQWISAHHVDARADLYSLGCTLFYLLTGQAPFRPTTGIAARAQVRRAHLREPPPSLRTLRPDVPPRLAHLVNRLLAKEPADRFASAADVAGQLKTFTRSGSRRTWPVAVLGSLVGAVFLALVLARPRDDQTVRPVLSEPAKALTDKSLTNEPAAPPEPGVLPMTPEEAQQLQKKWAEFLSVPVTVTNSLKMEFALVPPGEFKDLEYVLIPSTNELKPVDDRKVRVTQPYYLAATEVALRHFRRFVTETGHQSEVEKSGKGGMIINVDNSGGNRSGPRITWFDPGVVVESQDCPVVQVTWSDAIAFCDWLSQTDHSTYRLQTAAEWKWAARAGVEGTDLPWDRSQLAEMTWFRDNSENRPHAACGLKPNAWGLYDMLGNVSEWSLDYPDNDREGTITDVPKPASGEFRAFLGGNYVGFMLNFRISQTRVPPSHAWSTVGFRIVREIPQAPMGSSR